MLACREGRQIKACQLTCDGETDEMWRRSQQPRDSPAVSANADLGMRLAISDSILESF